MHIRPEEPGDRCAIRAVNESAFVTSAEADLVDALREHASPAISLVAKHQDGCIGHIMFSPVSVAGCAPGRAMGLAPVAVAPAHQRNGVGSALVRAGLEACRSHGAGAVFVLGHPGYYPRFGFVPAEHYGVACDYDVPPEVFMALELVPGTLERASGVVHYHLAFERV